MSLEAGHQLPTFTPGCWWASQQRSLQVPPPVWLWLLLWLGGFPPEILSKALRRVHTIL